MKEGAAGARASAALRRCRADWTLSCGDPLNPIRLRGKPQNDKLSRFIGESGVGAVISHPRYPFLPGETGTETGTRSRGVSPDTIRVPRELCANARQGARRRRSRVAGNRGGRDHLHGAPRRVDGWSIALYETTPGGAGYLSELAGQLGRWANAAHDRLFEHSCDQACYRYLKSYRNQFDHGLLNKELVRSMLFSLSDVGSATEVRQGQVGDGLKGTQLWLNSVGQADATGSPIEQAMLDAIRADGRLPVPLLQFEVRGPAGELLTVPDFAYPERKIAVYCDGFRFHGNQDTLAEDARKRNRLQA